MGGESAESISAVIRGLVACGFGEEITGAEWQKNGKTMIDALFAFQLDDNSFSHAIGGNSNDMATRQALIAVSDLVNGNVFYNITIEDDPSPPAPEDTTVRVRVEGATGSKADETVPIAGTALDALKAAVGEENVTASGGFITTILEESGQYNVADKTDTGWYYYVIRDGEIEPGAFDSGAGSYNVEDGDEVVFYIGAYDAENYTGKTFFPVVNITPNSPTAGQTLTIDISAKKSVWGAGLQDISSDETAAIGDYTVKIGEAEYTSSCGQVIVPDVTEGTLEYTVINANEAGYPDVVTYKGSIIINHSGNSDGLIQPSTITVKIAVVGKEGDLLYGPGSIRISEDDEYGLTAMSALGATGLNYRFSDTWDGFIESIAGIDNEGMSGWCYTVNDLPINSVNKLAWDWDVEPGDRIIWFYSTMEGEQPNWNELTSNSGSTVYNQNSQVDEEVLKEILTGFVDDLAELNQIVSEDNALKNDSINIKNADKKMPQEKVDELLKELAGNTVNLTKEVGEEETVVTDGEVSMLVPEKALSETKNLTVEELTISEEPKQFAVKVSSSTYEFGPSGTKFDKPVTISLKIAITEDMDIESLAPAWYDEESRQWIPIPGIIDLETGMVVFQIDHFTRFAVVNLPDRVSFADVDENISWAKDAIEILAGQGIINGTGSGFEPQRPITRAEFLKLVIKAAGFEIQEYPEEIFGDVNSSHWFADFVACAYSNNIINGYPDGTFRPYNNITRNEIAAIITRLRNEEIDPDNSRAVFSDTDSIPAWAFDGINYVFSQGIMQGYEDGTFKGNNSLTRAEAAVTIYRYLNGLSADTVL